MEPDYNLDEGLVDNLADKAQQASDEYRSQVIAEELLKETRELQGDPIEIMGEFQMISSGLRNLQRDLPKEQQGELMELRKELVVLRKKVLGM